MRFLFVTIAFITFCASCASSRSEPEVTMLDFRNQKGAYILGYTADREVRVQFEDQLVADLAARDILAWPSHPDIPDAPSTNRESVLAAAKAKKAMFVIIAEAVPPGGQAVAQRKGPGRISHEHPTLKDFYEHNRPPGKDYQPGEEVFVEVSAYLIQEDRAKLFWSGTTWTFNAEEQDEAIANVSATIADAIAKARRQFLSDN